MANSTTQSARVTLRLRQMILGGDFLPGSHLAEIPLAERLGVSRSPVRLALGTLEHEGLLTRTPRRGFVVREITIAEVADGFEVRSTLEALACKQAIERKLDVYTKVVLQECLEEGERMLSKGYLTGPDAAAWSAMNGRFHDAIVKASRNEPLIATYAFNASRPLVSPTAVAFNIISLEVSYRNMVLVQAEHEAIVKAMLRGDVAQASAMIDEHTVNSRARLARLLQLAHTEKQTQDVPGIKLVVG